ncbi:putative variant cofactor biosynthesis B12-binding domain/radical SAM domain protein 1 [Dehalogenimonas formicexedens]|uniref:Putative variant cofactor biosynthesis B12-binding domain/radical SAM domain protein 1 n=1 Tax=Dehalogenimonas formicexedens TaxID=1839801 RepID=A0A1P8F627_9CHLR|nr:B12 lower ligand biosynthesis radical SAM protein BzaD [Dehalogenimonas formicexedens]APV43802.1 putative variant cofactor biosynthesis B12-binding domain/radical SAM domain protein 1 [Dehalogenimonas formicexedens]
MKVLLIQAPSVESATNERVYPIGLVSVATHLKRAGHDVSLFDMNLQSDQFGSLNAKLLSERPDAIGLALRNIDPLANKTSSLIPPFVVTVRMIRALLPGVPIIAGGTGFTLFPERIMRELPEIGWGIKGEAELGLPALLAGSPPGEISGLCRRLNEDVIVNPAASLYSFDDYLVPDRDLLPPDIYKGINSYAPAFGIETKRGCPLQCAYCVYPQLQGKVMRCRKPAEVVDEIAMLNRKYGLTDFHFNDPVINMPVGHLEEICEEILRRGLKVTWTGFFREDVLTKEKVRLYEKSGCSCFLFSPDGFTQNSLDVLQKKLDVADVVKAAELTSGTDVLSVYHFMTNVPGETCESISQAKSMIDRLYKIHGPKRNLGAVVLNNIRIMPGTPIEAIARAEGEIDDSTDLLYPVYYNPSKNQTMRYRLEIHNTTKNVFMWQQIGERR